VRDAIATQPQANVSTALGQVEDLVNEEVSTLTQPTGTQGADPLFSTLSVGDEPHQLFTSIGVDLGARVSSKTKAKIWANQYIDFGVLLSVAPPRERYALSMTSSGACVLGQPHLTLEPYHTPRKVTTIQQCITAFNIFVTIYSEKATGDAPKLMKYCEVVRDLSHKSADWLFYDEQFRYLRQSAPHRCPWDQIHWELWLRAMSNFCGKNPSSAGADKANARVRFRPSTSRFPKGTCMSALNAKKNIRQANVRSHQPTSAPTSENPDRNLLIQVLDSQPVTPVKADWFENLLAGYSPALKTLLVDGFRNGFRISYIGELSPFESPDLQSALQNPEIVSAKLMKEIEAGRVVGPFKAAPFPNFRTSPIGILPKNASNEFRLIHHLSYPRGSSVNDSIPDECSSVHYATISDAMIILKKLGGLLYG